MWFFTYDNQQFSYYFYIFKGVRFNKIGNDETTPKKFFKK
jgi:hypothetical protein